MKTDSRLTLHITALLVCLSMTSPTLAMISSDKADLFKTKHQQKKRITQQEYTDAFEYFSVTAKKNDAFSQYYLGEAYEFGLGVVKNLVTALNWYEKAAANNSAPAQTKIGLFYYNAKGGLHHDESKAREWWEKAVTQNENDALFELGLSLCYSKVLQRNCTKGVSYLEQVANNIAHEKAYLTLGQLYYQGAGIRQDKQKAVIWLQRAADTGNNEARYMLATMYHYGDGVKVDVKKGIRLYEAAAKYSHVDSLYNLGHIYFKGIGVAVDHKKAYDLFYKAHQLGHNKSTFAIAVMHDKGLGIVESSKKAFSFYEIAGKRGLVNAQLAIADMYLYGNGVDKSIENAYTWFYCASTNKQTGDETVDKSIVGKKVVATGLTLSSEQRKKAIQLAKTICK